MTRDSEVQYEQDRLGNENRKLDTLRAQEGNVGGGTDEGLTQITTADTGTDQLLYSMPTNADRVYVTDLYAHNSQGTEGTVSLFEATLNGSNSITSTTRRSVPFPVGSVATIRENYSGLEFEKAISVNSEFGGYVAVGLVVDHDEQNEPESENY